MESLNFQDPGPWWQLGIGMGFRSSEYTRPWSEGTRASASCPAPWSCLLQACVWSGGQSNAGDA